MSKKTVRKSVKLNAIVNIIKQCSNILFPLLTYPYVSRILGAANLGKYSFADSILNVFLMTAALGIPTYAIREGARIRDDQPQLEKFCSEVFSINLIAMVASYVVLFVLMIFVPRLQKDSILIYILSITLFFNILGRDWVNSIFEDFIYISVRYVFFQTIAVILIFTFIRKPEDYILYTVIMLIANAGGYAANIFYTRRYLPFQITTKLNLRKHFKPILYLFCSSAALFLYVKSDIIILGFFRSDGEVGVYTLASKVYSIIKSLLNAITIVAIPRFSFYLGTGRLTEYKKLLSNLWKALVSLILPTIVGMFCMSEEIMHLIGGVEYVSGKTSLGILCLALFFAVFGCFYSQCILIPNRKEKIFFIATIISATLNVVLNIVLIPIMGINAAALTTLAAEVCVYSISRIYSGRNVVQADIRNILSVVVGCFSIVLICSLVKNIGLSLIIRIIISIVGSSIAYFLILLLLRNDVVLMLKDTLRKKIS